MQLRCVSGSLLLSPRSQHYGDGGYGLTKLSASLVSIAVLRQSADLLQLCHGDGPISRSTPSPKTRPEVDGLGLTGQVMPGVIRDRMKLSNLARGWGRGRRFRAPRLRGSEARAPSDCERARPARPRRALASSLHLTLRCSLCSLLLLQLPDPLTKGFVGREHLQLPGPKPKKGEAPPPAALRACSSSAAPRAPRAARAWAWAPRARPRPCGPGGGRGHAARATRRFSRLPSRAKHLTLGDSEEPSPLRGGAWRSQDLQNTAVPARAWAEDIKFCERCHSTSEQHTDTGHDSTAHRAAACCRLRISFSFSSAAASARATHVST